MNPSTRLVIDPDRPQPEAIQEAAQRLRRGDIALIPTDTVYGLAAHPAVPGAMERLAAAKVRDPGKPIAYLVDGVQVPERYGAVLGTMGTALAQAYWPGPLTLVVPVGERTEGFRMPRHAATLALLTACGGALRVTSANLSGEPPALTAGAAARELRDFVDMVLDAGPARGGTPSTVVEVRESKIRVLREGAVSLQELEGQT